MIQSPLYYMNFFIFSLLFAVLNSMFISYMDLKISSRIQRKLGLNSELSFLKGSFYRILRDFGKSKTYDSSHLNFIYYLFKPLIFIINIIFLIQLGSCLNSSKSDIFVFLLLFILLGTFSVFEAISLGKKDYVVEKLLGWALKFTALIPLTISVFSIVKITKTTDPSVMMKSVENSWFIFSQPVGFLVSIISVVIITDQLRIRYPGIRSIEKSLRFKGEIAGSLFRFVGTGFVVFLFTGGAQKINIKMITIPEEIVLSVKTYIVLAIVIIFRASVPILKFSNVFKTVVTVFIPLAIIGFLFSGGF